MRKFGKRFVVSSYFGDKTEEACMIHNEDNCLEHNTPATWAVVAHDANEEQLSSTSPETVVVDVAWVLAQPPWAASMQGLPAPLLHAVLVKRDKMLCLPSISLMSSLFCRSSHCWGLQRAAHHLGRIRNFDWFWPCWLKHLTSSHFSRPLQKNRNPRV